MHQQDQQVEEAKEDVSQVEKHIGKLENRVEMLKLEIDHLESPNKFPNTGPHARKVALERQEALAHKEQHLESAENELETAKHELAATKDKLQGEIDARSENMKLLAPKTKGAHKKPKSSKD
ncbi:hypothetical protein [Candidatus Hepatobacter penaei]|uniref:hypothetical protein n=1 Tax=Candidatus Hepatobacter penaei TaxID=1274402 RepID=UPI0012E00E63|nr:hypothetical protein [Candidatus Hepatobacter penaei]